ncbi:MAG TPA: serine hydrolase domain-containing protein [Actinoplanes sp.]
MFRRIFIILLAGAGLLVPTSAAVAGTDERGQVLQTLLDAVHAAGLPGGFAEVRNGDRRWTPTTGVADIATGEPVRDGMRHRVGSITKTFVSTTVLQLVGEGRIDLDQPVVRYLKVPVPRAVTVRMLLNHTSGLGDYDTTLISADTVVETSRTTYRPAELVRIGLAAGPTNAPGAAWSYSNTNYVLAGLIVEKVTGHSYRAEVSRRILRPLGLRDTYFEGADPLIQGPHMHGYVPWTETELRDFTSFNMSWAWAVGEIVSTAHDLNVFYRALLTGRLLDPALLAQMQTTADGTYGLGLYTVNLPCGRIWGHDGRVVGYDTVSWHTADGVHQVTYAQNLNFYPSTRENPHPIDIARGRFLVTALCGDQATTLSAPVLPELVDRGLGSTEGLGQL